MVRQRHACEVQRSSSAHQIPVVHPPDGKCVHFMERPCSVLIDVWRNVALRRVKRDMYIKNQRLDPADEVPCAS